MSPIADRIRETLQTHDAFNAATSGYQYERTPFENRVRIADTEIELQIELPTLDAVVRDQTVPEVVESGWQSTLRRRLGNVNHALGTDQSIAPDWDVNAATITVTYQLQLTRPDQAAEEIISVYDFVEGTYLQGVIPGYEYDEPVAGMIAKASARGDSDKTTADRGGTPL